MIINLKQDENELIQRAAEVRRMSPEQFMLEAALSRAHVMLGEHTVTQTDRPPVPAMPYGSPDPSVPPHLRGTAGHKLPPLPHGGTRR